jgi:hypothetical protein
LYFQAFLFINKATRHQKINNTHYKNLTELSDFMHVLNYIMKQHTKNGYFPMHIIFTTIYSLKEYKLNHNKYSEQKLNMSNFWEATEHYVHMYAKFKDFTFYVFL